MLLFQKAVRYGGTSRWLAWGVAGVFLVVAAVGLIAWGGVTFLAVRLAILSTQRGR